jgi:glycosyltransferase involved in cell wall biosynthesis
MTGLVSIVIPTFNRGYIVGRALSSVLSQTYPHREAIVVDDGSADDTAAVVGQFTDRGVRYLRHERNLGVAVARNSGVRMARGEFVGFLGSLNRSDALPRGLPQAKTGSGC